MYKQNVLRFSLKIEAFEIPLMWLLLGYSALKLSFEDVAQKIEKQEHHKNLLQLQIYLAKLKISHFVLSCLALIFCTLHAESE